MSKKKAPGLAIAIMESKNPKEAEMDEEMDEMGEEAFAAAAGEVFAALRDKDSEAFSAALRNAIEAVGG